MSALNALNALNLEIKTKLDDLKEALLESHPRMPLLLRDIHSTLKAQPEQVTLMTESEIAIIIEGLKKQTNTHITQSAKKSSTKKATLKSTLNAEDLGF